MFKKYFNMYQIFVKNLKNKSITVDINDNDTILDIKKKVYEKENIPIKLIKLTKPCYRYIGEDHYTLQECNIQPNTTLFLNITFSNM